MTRVTELDTPVVTIRLDIMEANIRRVQALLDWEKAPSARLCHPQEDHLVPLFVAVGAAEQDKAAIASRAAFSRFAPKSSSCDWPEPEGTRSATCTEPPLAGGVVPGPVDTQADRTRAPRPTSN